MDIVVTTTTGERIPITGVAGVALLETAPFIPREQLSFEPFCQRCRALGDVREGLCASCAARDAVALEAERAK